MDEIREDNMACRSIHSSCTSKSIVVDGTHDEAFFFIASSVVLVCCIICRNARIKLENETLPMVVKGGSIDIKPCKVGRIHREIYA